jgi:hypothetical protein
VAQLRNSVFSTEPVLTAFLLASFIGCCDRARGGQNPDSVARDDCVFRLGHFCDRPARNDQRLIVT